MWISALELLIQTKTKNFREHPWLHCRLLYENSISFNCARSDSYSKMMQAIVQYNDPSTFKPPSYNDLRVKILKKKKEETSNWVDNFKVHWETYGVTIMTDWWTDGKGRTLINFLVNCPKGTVFLKSIDGSAHIHDAELIYKMLKDVIEEVGEKNVIQVSLEYLCFFLSLLFCLDFIHI
ncbi:hypothetical protein GIB67_017037 [Kingdonia uniflora]|uniref:DUF659 domain-containing protein n=1 Tax=Kingdonia uniflora TaxID=39325 RepID=A0A7J7NCQ2_9MAGN|nr:hypothetical protein GIB67_017037 [Kingdonia uniflora]